MHFSGVANQPLKLGLKLDALRASQAPTVTVTINGQPLVSFPAGGSFSEYSFEIPRSLVGWDGNLDVSIRVRLSPPRPIHANSALVLLGFR